MPGNIARRDFLTTTALATALFGWLGRLAAHAAEQPQTKSCILLWMSGGPSHIDTFDLKPDAPADIRGEFRPIETSVPGIQVSEHFPRLARLMQHGALLRSMSTTESDHQLASYYMHTGYQKRAGDVVFPSLGSIVAKELGRADFPLPNFVCVGAGPRQFTRSGLLGPDYQPLHVTEPARGIDFIRPASQDQAQFDRQYDLLRRLESSLQDRYRSEAARANAASQERAVRLMTARQKEAFDLSREPAADRDRYGRGSFGQACLMARRLVETGVRFVEVLMGDGVAWDTHRDNFPRTKALSSEADVGMSTLIEDLKQRGLLDSTLVVWMGEFGRTPQCAGGGRNHWARAWTSALFGGGIRGGQVVGRTDKHAAEVVERPIGVPDFLASVCSILNVDYTRTNVASNAKRPISIVDTTKPVKPISELL